MEKHEYNYSNVVYTSSVLRLVKKKIKLITTKIRDHTHTHVHTSLYLIHSDISMYVCINIDIEHSSLLNITGTLPCTLVV